MTECDRSNHLLLHGRNRLCETGQAKEPDQHDPLLQQRRHHAEERASLFAGKYSESNLAGKIIVRLTFDNNQGNFSVLGRIYQASLLK